MTYMTDYPSYQQIDDLAANARDEDRREWEIALAKPLSETLHKAVLLSPYRRALMTDDGHALAVWGAHHEGTEPGVGQVWFVATPAATRQVHRLHSIWASEMAAMHTKWPTLQAWTLGTNKTHHKWLWARGFDMVRDERRNGAQYCLFSKESLAWTRPDV